MGYATPPKAASSRRFHDEGYVDRGVLNKNSVPVLPVLPERLAVITEEQDHASVIKLIALQPRHQAAQFMVGVGDLSVVRMGLILAAIRFGRIVRTVRIVQM